MKPGIDPEVVPYLEEYLQVFRSMMSVSATDHYLFPRSKQGRGDPHSEE